MEPFEDYKARPGTDTLRALLRAHQDAVYNVCFQVLRQEQDAQDAAQQVLLRLLDELPKIADAEHFRRWLYRASFHAALDGRKKRRRRMTYEQEARPMNAPSEETVEMVHEHIAALDDDLRALVAEHYFEQKPLAELAVARKCSTTAVWKKLERAKEKLRESISRAGFAASLPGLDAVLTSVKPVKAPKGLLSAGLMAKAATIGGVAVKLKWIAAAAAAVLAVTGGLTVGVLHQREERVARTPLGMPVARRANPPKVPIPAVAAATPVPPEAPPQLDFMNFMLAFQKAMEIAESGARWKEYRRIGINLQDEDFRRAEVEIAVKHGTREYFTAAFGSIMKLWLTRDCKEVLDLFRSLPPERGHTRAEMTKAILTRFSMVAPDAVLAYAKTLPAEEGRNELIKLLLPMTTSGARDAAIRADQLPKGDERTDALEKALVDWSNSDFRAAAVWAETLLTAEEYTSMMWNVLEVSGGRQNSPAAAEVALKIFKGKRLYNLGVEHLVKEWRESDPAAAAAFLLRLPVIDTLRNGMSLGVARAWTFRDPASALIWAEQLPESEERRECLRAVGGAMVKSVKADPLQALGLVQTLPEKERRPAMEVVVAAWAELDPPAAAAVALSFPGGPVGTDSVAQAWAGRDPEGARAWARTLPLAELRDAALRSIDNVRK